MYRALSARCNYLAQDRPDLSFSSKELCRDFSVPTIQSLDRLKRVMRYLKKVPRLVYVFDWQPEPQHLTVMVDTDFAGCKVTRRSTSGGVALRGSHCIRHWSTTQATLALSSGEAELTGLAKGIAQGIGLRSIASDLGIEFSLQLRTDATAAMGMSRRLGIGKVRHLDTSLLWVQEKVRSGDVLLEKVAGPDNQADCLTKYVSGPDLMKHLSNMGLETEEGRAETAPQLTTSVSESLCREKEVMREERRNACRQASKEVMGKEAQEGKEVQSEEEQARTVMPCMNALSMSYTVCGHSQSRRPVSSSQCPVCETQLQAEQCCPLPRARGKASPAGGASQVATSRSGEAESTCARSGRLSS